MVLVGWLALTLPAQAAVDSYIGRYLHVSDSIPLEVDEQGSTRPFSAAELTTGKQLFERNCLNCHVGGTTLPNPSVSLSLHDLQGATPPRDTIATLVAYLRQPMVYDGSEESDWCRRVPESWLSQAQVESLAGFILRAAQVAPGWGIEKFSKE
ncbi:MAG TPA: photosystem II cytochrome PsbV2 [Thermosynechococcaceae cyanobacterium]